MGDITRHVRLDACGAALWIIGMASAGYAQEPHTAEQPAAAVLQSAQPVDAGQALLRPVAPAQQASVPGGRSRTAPPGALPGPPLGNFMPGGPSGPPLQPQLLRWTENWQPLADRSIKRSPLEQLRYIPLQGSSGSYLSIGGEVRYAVQHFSNVSLRSAPNAELTNLQQRLRLIGDLHFGPDVRAFVELGDDRELASTFATPINRDHLDVRQAFVDASLPIAPDTRATVRAGRFELLVGTTKLIGLREARGNRFFFDGARATLIEKGRFAIDAFIVNPVDIHPGTFDDRTADNNQLRGIYASSARGMLIPASTVAIYMIQHDRPFARLSNLAGSDHRSSWGALLNGRVGGTDYSVEGVHQSGRFANTVINANAIFLDAGYTFAEIPLKPRIGARFNALSGDGKQGDGTVGTFAAPFGQAPIYTEAAWFAFSNIVDVYPSLTIKPSSRINISLGPDVIWRASSTDSMYFVASGFPSVLPAGNQRYVGTVYNLHTDISVTKNLSVRAQVSQFQRSSSFKRGGGSNGTFFEFWTALRF